jgi:hypothetical protein
MMFSRGFYAMLAVKMALLFGMAVIQVWMGLAWKSPDVAAAARKARIGLSLQILLGAVAVLLGMGLRAV